MPEAVNGIATTAWKAHPKTPHDWDMLAETMPLIEPSFHAPAGLKKSSGVVVREPDGRVWVVAPSNAFGGYKATFPKGRLDGKSAKVTALIEAFEESGLRVRLLSHLSRGFFRGESFSAATQTMLHAPATTRVRCRK